MRPIERKQERENATKPTNNNATRARRSCLVWHKGQQPGRDANFFRTTPSQADSAVTQCFVISPEHGAHPLQPGVAEGLGVLAAVLLALGPIAT